MLAIVACALTMATPLAAGSGSAEKTNKDMTKTAAMRSAWPAETLSGKITMVDPAYKLVVVETVGWSSLRYGRHCEDPDQGRRSGHRA
jgi:hypothetical protein